MKSTPRTSAARTSAAALAVSTAAALALTACGGDSGGDSGNEITVAFAGAVNAPKEDVATYAVAKEQGFLDKEKLKVKTINADGSSAAIQAVTSRSADITAADVGSILAAKEKGVPIKAIGGLVQNWPWRIAVKPDSPIKSGTDLKGKKIGVISLASGSAPYARAFAKDAGLDGQKDIDLLPVGIGTPAASALNTGKVDALALYTAPYAAIENSGTKLRYLPNSAAFQGIRSLTFAAREDTIKKKKDALTRYLRSAYQGILFSSVQPKGAMQIGFKTFPAMLSGQSAEQRLTGDTRVLQSFLDSATPAQGEPESFTNWGAISDAEWTKTMAYTRAAGQITEDIPISDAWDPSLLPAANQFDGAQVISKAKAYGPK
ncbi:ABC transporter substrate-binding protein [Actinomadura sp. KC06]|uniref:ABC transporter substrate-binding protein n=1 Tax=Actinomadura sp. KC06 TaxID=2530369 RepID=UPI00104CE600|nr:ABC transporter substrate-binding protein [Actinomadura sp. KC06]TDD39033.1 ABC transporter substrate-binding protein [Actinomadura sp. KC06]